MIIRFIIRIIAEEKIIRQVRRLNIKYKSLGLVVSSHNSTAFSGLFLFRSYLHGNNYLPQTQKIEKPINIFDPTAGGGGKRLGRYFHLQQ